jgi:hypothetical protein
VVVVCVGFRRRQYLTKTRLVPRLHVSAATIVFTSHLVTSHGELTNLTPNTSFSEYHVSDAA